MTPIFAIIDAPIVLAIVGVAVLLFGVDRIPKLARSMGEAKREFEAASRGSNPPNAGDAPKPPDASNPPPPSPPAPPQ